jgi:branched-subunit amino acid aminotransferase/4-amino-4-deoxychorismate lyase
MLVFLNGQIIREEDAKISISDLSYQFGYGLFETLRCENGMPVFFEDHYKRLAHSAKELGMTFPVELNEAKSWAEEVIKTNKLSRARIKIIISKKTDDKFNVLIIASGLDNLPVSYSLLGWTLSRDSNSVSFRHKTTSRADSYVAYKKALEDGYDDAIYLNEKNELVECTRANIFLVTGDKIITPLLESGILSGVTRSKILEIAKQKNLEIEEKIVHSLYLNRSDEVFITNAVIGIMPVSKIKLSDRELSFNSRYITDQVKKAYELLVKDYVSVCRI